MQWESSDPLSYLHAMRTGVPIELEALSYHSCPLIRRRVALRTNRVHVLERLGQDRDPLVVLGVLDNKICPPWLVELIGYWMIHSDNYFCTVWYMLAQRVETSGSVKAFLKEKEARRRACIRKELGLPPIPEEKPKRQKPSLQNNLSLLSERRLILGVLGTHAYNLTKPQDERIPWGVTQAGWLAYSTHWSKEVRDATHRHPCCPVHLQERSLMKKIISFLKVAFV